MAVGLGLGLGFVAVLAVAGGAAKPSLPAGGDGPPYPPLPPERRHISSRFGWRTDPVRGGDQNHPGIDLPAPVGTPVFAPVDGVVARIDRDGVGRGVTNGNAVFIGSPAMRWCFLHLSRVDVQSDQVVRRGQVIGAVGSTGKSTGPHLHFQVYRFGELVDPELLFTPDMWANPRPRALV